MTDFETPVFQPSMQEVFEDESPKVTDMRGVINSRPACIQLHQVFVSGNEFLHRHRHAVKKTYHEAPPCLCTDRVNYYKVKSRFSLLTGIFLDFIFNVY
jgi:hypothetical protein